MVLDAPDAERLADAAFDDALEALGRAGSRPDSRAIDLIAAYTAAGLRSAILQVLRRAALPRRAPPAAARICLRRRTWRRRGGTLVEAAAAAARELGAIAEPGAKVIEALARLERCPAVASADDPWPGDLGGVALPGGNGAALSTEACVRYTEALTAFREACEHRRAIGVRDLLDRLLHLFAERYARAKRDVSGLDFEDLELEARELLRADSELRERYRTRFARIMVDELQDTNRVQLELIESLAHDNLFMVGDAQQSIYGFRHADVELFEERGAALAAVGARATLDTNFRSRPEILEVINGVFERALNEEFRPLRAGATGGAGRIALRRAARGAAGGRQGGRLDDGGAGGAVAGGRGARAGRPAWRDSLSGGTAAARDVVLLTRATTDLRVYERALEERGIPTYVIGGRGYWAHPQVIDMVSYLEALANPRAEEALYTVLASPLVGVPADALVILAAVARSRGIDPWAVLRDPDGAFDGLDLAARERLAGFAQWFAVQRRSAGRTAVESLIDRVIELTGYDLAVLAMPGGQRRLANVRKLMRLAREHETSHGSDLHGFLQLVARRARSGAGDARECEAPVEGEALDAVRLMTIHRAKGLEFEVVCVADLGRGPRWRAGDCCGSAATGASACAWPSRAPGGASRRSTTGRWARSTRPPRRARSGVCSMWR